MRKGLPVSLLSSDEISEFKPGDYAFDGSCNPDRHAVRMLEGRYETFSVGVFQWKAKSRGGIKRGPVLCRFKGRTDNSSIVYGNAQFYIDGL